MEIEKKNINNYEIIYINDNWQIPAITEKQIFENIFTNNILPYNYIAFPWASYIDSTWIEKNKKTFEIINNEVNNKKIINKEKTYFTVVQHILFRNFIEIFIKLNIKYIFTPHKRKNDYIIEKKYNIFIIPISLFPVKINTSPNICLVEDKYIATFIGLVEHPSMFSNIREKMYENFKDKPDCMIKKNTEWFYEKNVYKNITFNPNIKDDDNYEESLYKSKFSLCPSGTGPNSIRLWETLSFGCVPVILSDDIELPKINDINYHDFCIFCKEDNVNNLYDILLKIDNDTIEKMSRKCIEVYNKYFSPNKLHECILYFFNNTFLNIPEKKNINTDRESNRIVVITQYYKIKTNDENYNNIRQKEIDYCLQKNIDNKYISEIHIWLEEELEFDFINKNNIIIKKNITGKRINYLDVFTYSNNNLFNNICILLNSDIYLDESIEILNHINFDIDKLFISLNRYEQNYDDKPALLHGLEIDEATMKNCESFLKPYQGSIWSQDTWIWKGKIPFLNSNFNFCLGIVGCDNWVNYLMNKNGYKILNCSKIISTNHYDKLSIVTSKFGISKGNVSKKNPERIGELSDYLFLENQHDIPDKYTTALENNYVKQKPKIMNLLIHKSISEIELNNSQVIASTFLNDNYNAHNALFINNNYWNPKLDDVKPFIQFNFENIYDISVIDIMGKPLDRNNLEYGYVKKFKISYCLYNNWKNDDSIYNGIEINNANYIKKIYLNKSIKCEKIKIFPIEYVNVKALKIKFYKIDYPKSNIFEFMCNNIHYYKQMKDTIFDYQDVNVKFDSFNKQIQQFNYTENLLGERITEGICLFTYVMNRSYNIYNNIESWRKQKVNQIIILDWNSKEDMNDYIKSLKDDRILYIRVINEKYFIRTFAQNLAARFCKFNKIMKIDSDIILSDNFFENHNLIKNNFFVGEYRCGRNKNEEFLHGNIYLFLNDYFKINGYNEYIKDYGWDDSDFTIRLMLCGLTKQLFNYDYLYHVPHEETMRTINLTNNMNSMLMTFVNKTCLENIIWNNNYKMQQFKFFVINNDFIICDRIKGDEYCIDKKIYNESLEKNTKLLKSWRIL